MPTLCQKFADGMTDVALIQEHGYARAKLEVYLT
jgi:hypothetical protein